MASGNPADLKITRSNTAASRKVNLILFDAHVKFLNFKANRGMDETMSHENKMVTANRGIDPNHSAGNTVRSEGIPQIKRAWAGVGKPIKESFWRMSILNLASLIEANTANNKPVHDQMPMPDAASMLFIMIPGNTPKLTTSASESSSFPIGLDTFNNLALNPSRKSKTQAAHTNQAVGISGLVNEQIIPTQPQIRFPDVSALGM